MKTSKMASTPASPSWYTPVGSIGSVVDAARAAYETGRSKDINWRITQLKGIRRLCMEVSPRETRMLA